MVGQDLGEVLDAGAGLVLDPARDRDLLDASAERAAELAERDPVGLPGETAADMSVVIAAAAVGMGVADATDARRLREEALRTAG